MRYITDGLYRFFEYTITDFIKAQRQNDWAWKAKQNVVNINQQRVADSSPSKRPSEEVAEVFPANPFAA